MRSKHIAIAVVVLAIGAAPAMAGQTSGLRVVPAKPVTPAKPAVWTPAPVTGIKWSGNGGRYAVWIR